MRILLVSAGSHGDINPFIAIGRALKDRGHSVELLVNPYFQKQVQESGVGFQPLGELVDLKRLDRDYPQIMHPWKGGRVVLEKLIVPTSADAYRRVEEIAAVSRPDVVVHHFIVPGAAWACEKLDIPCVHVVLAPINWLSRCEPLLGTGWSPVNPPAWLSSLLSGMMLPVMELIFDGPLSRLRRELALPKRRHLIRNAMREGALNLGMWSPVLRDRLADDPPQGVICGFPWHDRHGEVESAPEAVREFLDGGEEPILFCLGTAAVHVAGDFYEHAAQACRLLDRRGLLLVGPGRAPPAKLPTGVRAFAYAPSSAVMGRCAINVHHGGIGSTGQGMRMGRPTLVIPHAHDQWDNAARVKRLGISETLHRPKVTAARLAERLSAVLESATMRAKAAEVARLMAEENGAATAAMHIERLAHGRKRTNDN